MFGRDRVCGLVNNLGSVRDFGKNSAESDPNRLWISRYLNVGRRQGPTPLNPLVAEAKPDQQWPPLFSILSGLNRKSPLFVALCVLSLQAAEIHIEHSVIQTVLARQVFTDDGRVYVRANRTSKCNYAFLEDPAISAANGQLRIRTRFTVRTAADVFGRCVGLGDSFLAIIYATPYYKDGLLLLKDVRVDSEGADGMYVRRIRAALANGIRTRFSYNLYGEAKRIFEQQQSRDTFHKELISFDVRQIRVTDQDVVLVIDYVLRVK